MRRACRSFTAADARTLRAAVGSLCDLMGLATRTLEAFGPGATEEHIHADQLVDTRAC